MTIEGWSLAVAIVSLLISLSAIVVATRPSLTVSDWKPIGRGKYLGIALHPAFPTNPGVYLYWTESSTDADTDVLSNTPLLGNRVDRFVWNGSSLTFDRNLIRIRALQQDANQPPRGNHDGGVIAFGRDGKLYIVVGDVGRRAASCRTFPMGRSGPGRTTTSSVGPSRTMPISPG